MNKKSINCIVISALFIAIGVVLPIAFHMVGGNLGRVLLPMHIPVLIAGFYLPMGYAAIVGLVTPILSSLLTAMPPLYPTGVTMMFELATYAFVVSLLFAFVKKNRKLTKNNIYIYVILVIAMLCGRIVSGVAYWIVGTGAAFNPFAYIAANIATGWIGIVVQLSVIPIIVMFVKRNESLEY
ncbi:MAG TPA: ECF transporter S component [Caldisericia bacterium]|nr:ECF transporter S component [Caldisericia bacterium]HPF49344.1 ECF transporter S component [Caldisericia bacterium]HPI84420.1 ECF transporter S component [Caldisericia bacterium]HPQ93819.1 ECF transporter S component [Caldisericia bacterium]HRV75617.1 ECF transporter S component [Caldisericia bacterium]